MDINNLAPLQQFESLVGTRFQLYNSLFTSLPFHQIENTGILLSLFLLHCEAGYKSAQSPADIIDSFIRQYTPYGEGSGRYDLLFRFIQYTERQVVLFDALEDAAFTQLNKPAPVLQAHMQAPPLPEGSGGTGPEDGPPEVRLVLTAHPTQFYTGAVLGIISDLSEALKEDQLQDINAYLRQLGRTPFFNKEKPTPYDEAVNLMWYLEHVFYEAAGNVMHEMMPESGGRQAVVHIGFWPGGDRDGNQFVKTDTTLKVAAALHRRVLRCYHKEVRMMKRRLTFKGVAEEINTLERRLYAALYTEGAPLSPGEIIDSADRIHTLLRQHHNGLFTELIDAFRERVRIFGLHFASLDIRQDSSVHRGAIAALAGTAEGLPAHYATLTAGQQLEALNALRPAPATVLPEDEVQRDTLAVMAAIRSIQAANGEAGCHRYIISHCTSVVDVMEVYALFLLSGWQAGSLTVDIVPLFETIDDLEACGAVMDELYGNPVYRAHLARRGDSQTIMLGFSDGTKDGGYLMANWAIYKAKEALTAIARAHGIRITFFDGRGGPPARGGGKTQKFYASMGNNIAGRDIQLTIQGQTISSTFGTVPTAQHNIEQLIAAGIAGEIRAAAGPTLTVEEDALLARLAASSYKAYAALKSAPGFLDYLNEVSPLHFYADTNIGSRPARRSSGALRFEDLRAIPYVGAWSQLKQNVPGYYGVGAALQQMKEEGRWAQVQALYRQSAYFRALMDNCEMAMKKCFFPLTAYLSKDPRYSEVWQRVYHEYELTRTLTLELTGGAGLMDAEPVSAASIGLRERIVLPLLTIQQYALGRLREAGNTDAATLEKLVIRCSFGIINAGRNAV